MLTQGRRLYTYDRRVLAKRELNLSHYDLDGLMDGRPVTLYHGTTKLFRHFSMDKSRDELVEKFYGRGIFLTPRKRVAVQYAEANRNIGFEPSIIDDLKRKNPNAAKFLRTLYAHGRDGWELYLEQNGFKNENPAPGEGSLDTVSFLKHLGGVDPNTLGDLAEYIIGSKMKRGVAPDDLEEVMNIFHGAPTGTPEWAYKELDEIGIDSKVYRPKVYTAVVTVSNTLVTASKSQASKARSKGYECVVYFGPDLVEGVPEVAVFNLRAVRIKHIEVV